MKLIAFTKWIVDKPIEEMAKIVADAGFDGVDLPVRENAGIPAEVAIKSLPEMKKVFEDHGLALERLVTDIVAPRDDLDRLLETFRSAGITKIRLGGKALRRGTDVRQGLDAHRRDLEALEPYFLKHGIHGALQIHSGDTAHATMGLCLLCVEGRDPRALGIQVDTGHLAVAGESVEFAIALAGPYLHSINFKAIRRQPTIDPKTGNLVWQSIVTPLRDATINWTSVVDAIRKAGYTDPVSIHAEYRSPYYRYETNTELTTRLIAEDRAFAAQLFTGGR